MDAPAVASVVAPFPKCTIDLRSLSYGKVGPAPKKILKECRGLHCNQFTYSNRQVIPETNDKE
jgi:hypothetical protein